MQSLIRLLFATLAISVTDASAQQQPSSGEASRIEQSIEYEKVAVPTPPAASEEENKRYHEYRMQQQKDKVTFAILLAGVAVVAHLIVLGFLYRREPGHIVGATGLVYIVFGTILLVVIATTEAQLTAAIGILGAIAGYLFGRMRREEPDGGEDAGAPAVSRSSAGK